MAETDSAEQSKIENKSNDKRNNSYFRRDSLASK